MLGGVRADRDQRCFLPGHLIGTTGAESFARDHNPAPTCMDADMSRIRLKTLVFAGWLTLEAAGCHSCVTSSVNHFRVRTPRSRGDNYVVATPQAPVAASDQDRPIPPTASPSLASPAPSAQSAGPAETKPYAPDAQPADSLQQAEQQAAAALKKLGGRVTTDADGHVAAVDLAQTAITDEDLKLLAACPQLVELNLRATLVSDAGLETVSRLSQLEFLGLTGTMVTDAGLEHLVQLGRLRFITLGHTSITDAGLPALARCTQLEGLNLKSTAVTAAGLVQVQSQVPQCRIVSDVTTTTSIDSEDLPLPVADKATTTTEPAPVGETDESADPALPPSDAPRALPDNLTDPFDAVPDATSPQQPATDVPPAPQPSERLQTPEESARVLRLPRRPAAANGPARRLEHVLADSLADPTVLRAIARSYAERGEWEAAAVVLRVAVERAPDDHDLHFELGIAEARSGDYVAALMHLQQCGDLSIAHYNLGILMNEAGLTDASILAFRSALRYDPDLTQARLWLTELAPKQAAAAGQRSHNGVAPIESAPAERDDAEANGAGVEIRPASGRRPAKRPLLGATHLGSQQPGARD